MSEAVQRYLSVNRYPLSLLSNWESFRFVCIDSESTGLDPRKDRIVSLGGIGVVNDEITIWDQFSAVLPVSYNTASVTVHGITREESASGMEEPVALEHLLEWLQDGVLVGHHLQHDLTLINQALNRHFGMCLRNVAVDTMEAFHAVSEAGGFRKYPSPQGRGLDALCQLFEIVPHDRHTALGDAYLTAHILVRILKEAARFECWNLQEIRAWHGDQAFVGHSGI